MRWWHKYMSSNLTLNTFWANMYDAETTLKQHCTNCCLSRMWIQQQQIQNTMHFCWYIDAYWLFLQLFFTFTYFNNGVKQKNRFSRERSLDNRMCDAGTLQAVHTHLMTQWLKTWLPHPSYTSLLILNQTPVYMFMLLFLMVVWGQEKVYFEVCFEGQFKLNWL